MTLTSLACGLTLVAASAWLIGFVYELDRRRADREKLERAVEKFRRRNGGHQ